MNEEYKDYMDQTTSEDSTVCNLCQTSIKVSEAYPLWTGKKQIVTCKKCFEKYGGKK